ncbi:MAG TPA: hypothetical protein PLA90_13430 [Candidatus Sumerlaeota bacterium]|nr:hypothetical protein [Candidatus Sumerlaeota bacterium]
MEKCRAVFAFSALVGLWWGWWGLISNPTTHPHHIQVFSFQSSILYLVGMVEINKEIATCGPEKIKKTARQRYSGDPMPGFYFFFFLA